MDNEAVISVVRRWAHCDESTAWLALRSVLGVLADRLDRNECRHLAAELPDRIAPLLFSDTPAQSFDVDEFLHRVAECEGTDLTTAQNRSRAVFAALRAALPAPLYSHMRAELSKDFVPLVEPVAIVDSESFLDLVGEQTGLDHDEAWRAVSAVLNTLASRIAPGEVDDLIARLPAELHEPLKEGRAGAEASSRRMRAEGFVVRVARQEGTDPAIASGHIRAVMTALRKAIGDQEYYDITVELPPEYERLIGKV